MKPMMGAFNEIVIKIKSKQSENNISYSCMYMCVTVNLQHVNYFSICMLALDIT